MPFDQKTPCGYVISTLIQSVDVYFCAAVGGYLTICYFSGSCWLLKTIVRDISNDFSHLNLNKLSTKDRVEMRILFCDIVRNISDAKQLSEILCSEIYQKVMKFSIT